MNSSQLKQQYPDIYKKFFDNYDLVLSLPLQTQLSGVDTGFSNGNTCSLLQKLPLRNYIGINFENKCGEIEYVYKETEKSEFRKGILETEYPIYKDILQKIGLDYQTGFLSEYSRNDTPSILGLTVITAMLIQKQLCLKDLESLNLKNPEYNAIINKILNFDNQLMKSYKLFSKRRNFNSYLGGCILQSNSHIAYFQKNRKTSYRNLGSDHHYIHLDLTTYIINPNKKLGIFFQSNYLNQKNKLIMDFIKNEGFDDYDINFLDGIEILDYFYTIEIMKDLKQLYEGFSINSQFFNNITSQKQLVKSIFYDDNKRFINTQELKKLLIKHIGFEKNLCVIQPGDRILVFGNKNLNLHDGIINEINKDLGTEFTLDYDSNKDGYEIDGIKLEQRKSKGIFSEFSSKFSITTVNSQGKNAYTNEYDSIDKKSHKGIILDCIKNKIYINGKTLQSKHLHSQKGTIEIMEILIKHFQNEVYNHELPASSYSKNKSEMHGKIILPFIKLVEKETGKRIPLIIKGGITDYYIKLDKPEVDIVLMKKLY